ncbi:MAG: argininosuccinate synthase [Candidatus Dormibacteria bacterium]
MALIPGQGPAAPDGGRPRCVLAFSGGLDTTVAVHWLSQERGFEVVTLSVDLGETSEPEVLQRRALGAGARAAHVVDAKAPFISSFAFPTLQAGALYQGEYPLATALARPLIARLLVEVAAEVGATAVAHGCTAKGNDQVRFDVAVAALAPSLEVVAPLREWRMGRSDEIAYAGAHGLQVTATIESPYSVDANLWGRSVETGALEDPDREPPPDAFAWTTAPAAAPADGQELALGFEEGIPRTLDGEELDAVELVGRLNRLAGAQGVGRIDHIEDRLVGIKSREVYEAPAAVVLGVAHRALEGLTLTKDVRRFKRLVADEWAQLTYDGLWFSALRQGLAAFVSTTQRFVTGEVRLRLRQGAVTVQGRKSPHSLYRHDLATYERGGDRFRHEAAQGFLEIFGLPLRTQAAAQGTLEELNRPLLPQVPRGISGKLDEAVKSHGQTG